MTVTEGVLHIDKPEGITSHDVVNRIRRLTGIRRVGHAGTLDPLATGVLLLCVGRATRLVEYLVGQSKIYTATVRLGQETDTYDAEGEIVAERPFSHITIDQIQQALTQFRGTLQQTPPIYSAIKQNGRPLYKLARTGAAVHIPAREITIYALHLLPGTLPDLQLSVHCSSGTYIRSLAHDLGQALGCGGHITALRRTNVGGFHINDAVSLSNLDETNWGDYLLAADTAVAHLPRLDLSAAESSQLQQGQRPPRPQSQPPTPLLRAYEPAGQFVGIVTAHEAYLQARKIFL